MTWGNRIVRIALVVGVLGALALASGANYVEGLLFWTF
jgi:hypothetical protein